METCKLPEKEKNIIEAVNARRGGFGEINGATHVSKCVNKCFVYHVGSIVLSSDEVSDFYWKVICTIEEYNQCVDEMADARWIGDTCHVFDYESHKASCEIKGIDTSNKTLLKENCDYGFYDKPVEELILDMQDAGNYSGDTSTLTYGAKYLDKDGQPCRFIQFYRDDIIGHLFEQSDINNLPCISVSHYMDIKPIKTADQIAEEKEIEDAQIKQIDSDCELLVTKGFIVDPIVLRCLQSHGRLAEIVLPLKND